MPTTCPIRYALYSRVLCSISISIAGILSKVLAKRVEMREGYLLRVEWPWPWPMERELDEESAGWGYYIKGRAGR